MIDEMKVVLYTSSSLLKPAFGVILDEATRLVNEGHDVTIVYCDNAVNYCSYNPNGISICCMYCRLEFQKCLSLIPKSIKIKSLSTFLSNKRDANIQEYANVVDLKGLEYNNVNIGYSAYSLYIDNTRNSEPNIDVSFCRYFNKLLTCAQLLVDAFGNMLDILCPDIVFFYNGRLLDVNPLMKLCAIKNIDYICLEVYNTSGKRYKQYYKNSTPHNPQYVAFKVKELWNDNMLPLEIKVQIGRSFFERKISSLPAGDKVYTLEQKKGCLPENWDTNKCNIIIFNSSEDELSSLGDDFEKKNLFSSQYSGIVYLLELFKDNFDYHFYLRIHPNLKGVRYSYHMDLYTLPYSYKNVTIISPVDIIDSYALMNAGDKIVVFTSSMGVEASYWGKPVILLGNTFYYDLDICYKPSNKKEIYSLIVSQLEPKSNLDSIKYAYYLFHRYDCERWKYVDFDEIHFNLLGKDIECANYQKFMGSNFLFAIRHLIIIGIVKLTSLFKL